MVDVVGCCWMLDVGCLITKMHTNAPNSFLCSYAFVIVASDGVWDVVSNEEAVGFVSTQLDQRVASNKSSKTATKATTEATTKESEKEAVEEPVEETVAFEEVFVRHLNAVVSLLVQLAIDRGSQDNVSAVIVWLGE